MAEKVLDGVKILDLSQLIAGPYATRMMAGFGAEVIKVEQPGRGDIARRLGPFPKDTPDPEASGLFHYLNINKKSITLNLNTATGREIFLKLVERADAVIESFRPGRMERWGLGYTDLEKVNKRIVMTSISNFGQSGPYKEYKGTDLIFNSISGILFSGGVPSREPVKPGGNLTHYYGALHAAFSTLAALMARDQSGEGQYLDVSIMESSSNLIVFWLAMANYFGGGRPRSERLALTSQLPAPVECKNGYVGVNPLAGRQWELLYSLAGKPELAEDPRFMTPQGRTQNGDELREKLLPAFKEKTKEEAFHEGQLWRIPMALVPDAEELTQMAQFNERDFFVEVDHPKTGKVKMPGAPFKMSESPWKLESPAPLLGQHNQEIIGRRLGYSNEDLARLARTGVI